MTAGRLGRLYRGQTDIDFIGRRKLWFTISGAVLLACIASLWLRGLNYGIEFEGGVSIQAPVSSTGPLADAEDLEVIAEIRDALAEFDASDAQIQVATSGDERSVIVQTKEIDDPEIQQQVVGTVAETVGSDTADTDSQRIGSKWGAEITRKAVRALIIFMLVIFAFISWRFEWKMAVAALIALSHDILVTAGIYSMVGFEVTPSTVVALLTILGYSLYDTVVVFDKVEENTAALATSGRMTYQDSANLAMNQVFMRSLNTSLTTLLPTGALLFVGVGLLGAGTLQDLALALLVGIGTSSYSSIFVATPVLSIWKEREPRYRSVREKVLRDAHKAPPPSAAPGDVDEATAERAPAPRPVGSSTRPPARAKVGSKKAKRRKRR